MSNEQEHIEEHSSPIKTPKQLIVTVILAFVVPIAIIILLVNMVASGAKVGAGSDTLSTEAVTKRIAPVAGFELVDANAPKVFKTGEQVFQAVCTACHTAGVAGAPKVGDNAAWAPFIKSGFDAMMNVALHGKGGMPAKGGNPTLSDFEVARAVVYMANKSGGSLPEPAAPAEEGAKKEKRQRRCHICHVRGDFFQHARQLQLKSRKDNTGYTGNDERVFQYVREKLLYAGLLSAEHLQNDDAHRVVHRRCKGQQHRHRSRALIPCESLRH